MPVGWGIVEARAAGTDPSFWQATSRGAGAEGGGGVLDYGGFVVSLSLFSPAPLSFLYWTFVPCVACSPHHPGCYFLSAHTSSFTCMFLRFGRHAVGAILSEPVVDPAAPKIEGSVMLARAETREEVVEQLRRDTYFRSGVWDWEKVVIYPVSVFRALFGGWEVRGKGESGKEGGGKGDVWVGDWAGLMGCIV